MTTSDSRQRPAPYPASADRVAHIEVGGDRTVRITGMAPQDVVDAIQHAGSRVVIHGNTTPPDNEGLSVKELEVVTLIGRGFSNAEIAEMQFLSINTIKSYIRTAYAKMGVKSRSETVLWVVDRGLADPHHPRE